MASAEEDREETGSLFEGMILFNPSQVTDVDHHHHPVLNPPDVSTSSSSSPFAQPLDENLFSDLTLITSVQTLAGPQPQIDEVDPSPTPNTTAATTSAAAAISTADVPSVCRQISRKKRRAGIRIGYGREAGAGSTPLPDDQCLPLSDVDSRSVNLDYNTRSSSYAAEEEKDASFSSSESHTDSHLRPLCGLPDSHPSSPTAAAARIELLDDTFKDKDSSEASIGHDALQNHDLVSDAPSLTADKQENNEAKASVSTEVKFEQLRAQISEKLKHARDLADSISAKRKDCTRRRRKAAENLNLASLKYKELERDLEEACEAEDFEMAESLSESLAAAEKEKEAFLNVLRDAEADSDAIDSNMREVLECQIAVEEECATSLEHFALDAANNADLISKEAEIVSSKEIDKWLSSTETLEVKKMEVEIESHLINEARLVLNESIEHSVEDDRRQKEYLCKKKDMLTDELNRLLALVKEKEEEIAHHDSNIKAVEKRIVDVISGFQETRSTIDAKYDKLQSVLSQLELESGALAMKKKEIDDFLSQEEHRRVKLRELARISIDEAKEYQEVVGLRRSLLRSILKSMEDKVSFVKSEEKLSEDVQMLRQEVSAERASLQELSSIKSSIQQEIASTKQRIFFIDKRVPELEAEKKVAAAARNFKEAARISAEAKTLSVEKEGVLSKMEGAVFELRKLEEKIKGTIDRLQKTEGLISLKEKEVAMARFQRLCLIAGAALAERSAAVELGDLEEANLLGIEAEAAESEAKKLQLICNFEEEFANLPQLFISMELVSNLGRKQLAELAASVHISAF